METQVVPEESVDPIQSFGDDPMEDQVDDMPTPKAASKLPKKNVVDHGLSCECGVDVRSFSFHLFDFSYFQRLKTNLVSARADVDAGITCGQLLNDGSSVIRLTRA
jgi:hypothetical protein